MRLSATPEVGTLVRERGGRLFVWPDRQRCYQGATYLLTASNPPPNRAFQLVEGPYGFDQWIDPGNLRLPHELHLEVRGSRTKRVEAYWNGCVFVA